MSPRVRRRALLLVVLLGVAAALSALTAAPASAHAVVVSSQPADGERLTTAPSSVTVQFSEAVQADLGGLKVVNAEGKRVDSGADRTSGDALTVGLESDLPDGTYVASYRVVSADGHPVKGAIVFAVGDASASGVDVNALVAGGGSDGTFDVVGAVSRFLAYLGALTAAGLAFFLVFVHDGGPEARGLARVVRLAAVVAVIGALGTLAAQAALATGRGWDAVFDPSVLHQVLTETLDWATLVLFAGLVVVLLSLEARKRGTRQSLAFYGGMATTLSFVLWGHTTEGDDRWVAVLADAVHVSAAAIWLGGLIGLAAVLFGRTRAARRDAAGGEPAPATPPPEPTSTTSTTTTVAADATSGGTTTLLSTDADQRSGEVEELRGTATIVSRFSNLALVTVLLLWIAGTALAWVELGSLDALRTTTYGRLVLVKVGIVLVVALLAAYNRFRLVPDILEDVDHAEELSADTEDRSPTTLPAEPVVATTTVGAVTATEEADPVVVEPGRWAADGMRRLARTVVIEALAIVVVLGVTSVLVNTTPGRSVSGDTGVVNQTLPITTSTPDSTLNLVVAAARSGLNSVHLSYYDAQGRPIAISGPVKIEFSLPEADLGPISRDTVPAGPGHYILEDADLSPSGTWSIAVVTRLGEFDQQRTTFTVKIR